MKIGIFKKISRIDYPGKKAAVIYTQGCNWRCPFCHNRALTIPADFQPPLREDEIFVYLRNASADGIEAVVVTGGEPTLQPDLPDFLRQVRALGYATKVETNGSRPDVLAVLLNEHLVDYLALDVKGPLSSYRRFTGSSEDTERVKLSLELVRRSGLLYELRTTLVGGLHSLNDIQQMVTLISGASRFAVQTYQLPPVSSTECPRYCVPSCELFHEASVLLRDQVEEFIVR